MISTPPAALPALSAHTGLPSCFERPHSKALQIHVANSPPRDQTSRASCCLHCTQSHRNFNPSNFHSRRRDAQVWDRWTTPFSSHHSVTPPEAAPREEARAPAPDPSTLSSTCPSGPVASRVWGNRVRGSARQSLTRSRREPSARSAAGRPSRPRCLRTPRTGSRRAPHTATARRRSC